MNVDDTQHELDSYPTFTFTLGNGNETESKVLLYYMSVNDSSDHMNAKIGLRYSLDFQIFHRKK